MAWEVRVDQNLCMASGMCAALAPEVFVLGDEHARTRVSETAPDDRVLEAADVCPAQAITVHEGSRVIGPRPD
ncbi:ferredoxin [Streptomyces sp. NPDC001941]|uniref:ferredoxin n=1 Tax=Streptomyces sp. NPDC001941 TaxID=3154659 RepID=UPI003330B7D4